MQLRMVISIIFVDVNFQLSLVWCCQVFWLQLSNLQVGNLSKMCVGRCTGMSSSDLSTTGASFAFYKLQILSCECFQPKLASHLVFLYHLWKSLMHKTSVIGTSFQCIYLKKSLEHLPSHPSQGSLLQLDCMTSHWCLQHYVHFLFFDWHNYCWSISCCVFWSLFCLNELGNHLFCLSWI